MTDVQKVVIRSHQLGLDEVADHLVVEVLDGGPLDPLLDVLLLQSSTRVSTCTSLQAAAAAAFRTSSPAPPSASAR